MNSPISIFMGVRDSGIFWGISKFLFKKGYSMIALHPALRFTP
jgi:hypothetical protein